MGLRHLAFSSDAQLSRLAREDILLPRTPKNLVDLADGWYDWGLEKDASTQEIVWARALDYYKQADSPGLRGTRKEHIDQRVAELTAAFDERKQARSPGQSWGAAPPGQVRSFEGHQQNITALAISDDGSFLVSAAEDCTVRLWNLDSSQEVWRRRPRPAT